MKKLVRSDCWDKNWQKHALCYDKWQVCSNIWSFMIFLGQNRSKSEAYSNISSKNQHLRSTITIWKSLFGTMLGTKMDKNIHCAMVCSNIRSFMVYSWWWSYGKWWWVEILCKKRNPPHSSLMNGMCVTIKWLREPFFLLSETPCTFKMTEDQFSGIVFLQLHVLIVWTLKVKVVLLSDFG